MIKKDDPVVSGYVVADGPGSLIYARVQVAPGLVLDVRFGLGILILMLFFVFIYLLKSDFGGDNRGWVNLSFRLLTLAAMSWVAWRGIKRFKKEVNPKLKKQLMKILEADLIEQETTL